MYKSGECHMNKIIQISDLHYYGNDQMNRVYSSQGISPAIKTVSGGDVK